MKCRKCKAIIPDESIYCRHCGVKVSDDAKRQNEIKKTPHTRKHKKKFRTRLLKLLLIAGLVYVVYILAVVGISYIGNRVLEKNQSFPFYGFVEGDSTCYVTNNFKVHKEINIFGKSETVEWASSDDIVSINSEGVVEVERPEIDLKKVILTEKIEKFGLTFASLDYEITVIPSLPREYSKDDIVDPKEIMDESYLRNMRLVMRDEGTVDYMYGDFGNLHVFTEEDALALAGLYAPYLGIDGDMSYGINRCVNSFDQILYILDCYYYDICILDSSISILVNQNDYTVERITNNTCDLKNLNIPDNKVDVEEAVKVYLDSQGVVADSLDIEDCEIFYNDILCKDCSIFVDSYFWGELYVSEVDGDILASVNNIHNFDGVSDGEYVELDLYDESIIPEFEYLDINKNEEEIKSFIPSIKNKLKSATLKTVVMDEKKKGKGYPLKYEGDYEVKNTSGSYWEPIHEDIVCLDSESIYTIKKNYMQGMLDLYNNHLGNGKYIYVNGDVENDESIYKDLYNAPAVEAYCGFKEAAEQFYTFLRWNYYEKVFPQMIIVYYSDEVYASGSNPLLYTNVSNMSGVHKVHSGIDELYGKPHFGVYRTLDLFQYSWAYSPVVFGHEMGHAYFSTIQKTIARNENETNGNMMEMEAIDEAFSDVMACLIFQVEDGVYKDSDWIVGKNKFTDKGVELQRYNAGKEVSMCRRNIATPNKTDARIGDDDCNVWYKFNSDYQYHFPEKYGDKDFETLKNMWRDGNFTTEHELSLVTSHIAYEMWMTEYFNKNDMFEIWCNAISQCDVSSGRNDKTPMEMFAQCLFDEAGEWTCKNYPGEKNQDKRAEIYNKMKAIFQDMGYDKVFFDPNAYKDEKDSPESYLLYYSTKGSDLLTDKTIRKAYIFTSPILMRNAYVLLQDTGLDEDDVGFIQEIFEKEMSKAPLLAKDIFGNKRQVHVALVDKNLMNIDYENYPIKLKNKTDPWSLQDAFVVILYRQGTINDLFIDL